MRKEDIDAKRARRKFRALKVYEETKNPSLAAEAAHVSRGTVSKWCQNDEEFREAWNDIEELICDNLESEAYRRAHDGTLKPVFQGGMEVGQVREYSDSLLQFLLKGRRSKVFRERVEHSGDADKPITVKVLKGVSIEDIR